VDTQEKAMESEVNPDKPRSFENLAAQSSPSIVREFWDFLRTSKKWWITPIVVILLLFGALILLSGTAAAPFIYTLF
jgi:hypothetical protein